jgi:hypothetical protein
MQISGETVGEVRAVADMHQRKAEMARQSDAFIALPGERARHGYFCSRFYYLWRHASRSHVLGSHGTRVKKDGHVWTG